MQKEIVFVQREAPTGCKGPYVQAFSQFHTRAAILKGGACILPVGMCRLLRVKRCKEPAVMAGIWVVPRNIASSLLTVTELFVCFCELPQTIKVCGFC